MSEGCPGCFSSARGQQIELENIRKKAKDYARQSSITIAIYREGFEYKYISAELAVQGNYPVVEFVSQH